ncbi:MAG: phosphocholine cytidylyltransferase family protein [Candidatus Melainabacteria bacterium]|nr:phosphocholine cytidylyltransferase family protein [Candidatus Melainabacteria bacterium]
MKAIIMAAGIGSRLLDLNQNRPKCLIKADGQSLISRSVDLLKSRGISDISVVTGFKSDAIKLDLKQPVTYFHNSFYEVTNSIASLWLAREKLTTDVILLNADLYYDPTILDIALAQVKPAVMISDCTRIETADFRFGFSGSKIVRTGNKLTNQETDGEYVGIVRIDRSFIRAFRKRLERMIENGDFRNWWEGVLYSFIEEGLTINHKDVGGRFWTEVDNHLDYERLQCILRANSRELSQTS